MKTIIKISALLLVFISACQSDVSVKKFPDNYENNFFTLNLKAADFTLDNFKDHFFTTFPHDDPTYGDIVYDRTKWKYKDLISYKIQDGLYAYVKYRDDEKGYDSFRFTSKFYYNLNASTKKILFVFKGKLPSEKGVWPAWWLNGSNDNEWIYKNNSNPTDDNLDKFSGKGEFYNTSSFVNSTDWPSCGEIDIIETINGDNIIHNTIHTCPQMCNSIWNSDTDTINCANANDFDPNPGCSGRPYKIEKPEGTFACLWEKSKISFYYWDESSDVKKDDGPLSTKPNPALWDKSNLKNRVELFDNNEKCVEEIHKSWQCENCSEVKKCEFKNLKMVFNTTICGMWAGNKFDKTKDALTNCKEDINGQGVNKIHNQFMKIEYISVSKIDE